MISTVYMMSIIQYFITVLLLIVVVVDHAHTFIIGHHTLVGKEELLNLKQMIDIDGNPVRLKIKPGED